MNRYKNILMILLIAVSLQFVIACSPGKPITEPVAVTKAVFEAINSKHAEVAASYFAEDAEIITSFGQPVGNLKILNFFRITVIPYKMHLEITNMSISGDNVTGTFTLKDISAYKTPVNMEVLAVVSNGKIKSMSWSPKK